MREECSSPVVSHSRELCSHCLRQNMHYYYNAPASTLHRQDSWHLVILCIIRSTRYLLRASTIFTVSTSSTKPSLPSIPMILAHYHRHWELEPSDLDKNRVRTRWGKVGARNGASKLQSDFAKLQDQLPELQDELFNVQDDMDFQDDVTNSRTRSPIHNTREIQGWHEVAQG